MPESARACPVCDSAATAFYVEKAGYGFSRCGDCGYVFVDPAIPQDELFSIYNAQPKTNQEVRYPFDKAPHRRRRARLRAWRLARYVKDKDVIDIGCGGGFMVEAMRQRGARAVGLDLDPEAIAFAEATHHQANQFFCEPLDQFEARGLRFDFGHSSQVIEHVADGNDFVAAWARLIKPGGRFFLKTPDRDHWRAKTDPASWPDPPAYVQYFTRKSIRKLMTRHGFEVERMFLDFKSSIQLIARRTA